MSPKQLRPTITLFDIDDTLITSGGAGRRALERTFADLYGRPDACDHIHFGGMTDRAVARLALTAIGEEPSRERVDALLDTYVTALVEEVGAVPNDVYRVHPGMRLAITAARGRQFAVGLGTGNTRAGAKVKLDRVALFEHFSFGGFGCDAEDRAELLQCGARRGAEQLGLAVSECRVVVIGDTPLDVHAALAIGAECLAVETGRVDRQTLLDAGATYAFRDFEAAGALEALIYGSGDHRVEPPNDEQHFAETAPSKGLLH